jgi:uncharacterized protein YvpB
LTGKKLINLLTELGENKPIVIFNEYGERSNFQVTTGFDTDGKEKIFFEICEIDDL